MELVPVMEPIPLVEPVPIVEPIPNSSNSNSGSFQRLCNSNSNSSKNGITASLVRTSKETRTSRHPQGRLAGITHIVAAFANDPYWGTQKLSALHALEFICKCLRETSYVDFWLGVLRHDEIKSTRYSELESDSICHEPRFEFELEVELHSVWCIRDGL